MPGCANAHRAKGLCSTHYNQQHQPNRHAKTTVECAWCGNAVRKARRARHRPTCSDQCRNALQFPPKCDLPEDHWALWFGATSAWPRLPIKQCAQCEEPFAPNTLTNTHCSKKCRAKAAWTSRVHASGGKTHIEWLATDRTCADCGDTYNSPHAGSTRCAPCHTAARRRAGAWITRARRQRLYARDAYVCHLCGDTTDPNAGASAPNFPSLDHLLPRSKGGGDEDANLATACMECNWVRSDDDLHRVGSLTLT